MRRLVAVVLAVIVGVGLMAAPATAAPADQLNRRVSGPFDGTTQFEAAAGCSFVFQVWEGTYQTTRGQEGTFRLEGCVDLSGSSFLFTGTFRLVAPNGAVLTGTVSGPVFTGGIGGQTFTLTVQEGTKNFRHAVGTIQLLGGWQGGTEFDGTLTGSLQRR